MHEQFKPNSLEGKIAHFIEEAGESLQAVAKMQRFGPDSVNPLLKPEEQITNKRWAIKELYDLLSATYQLKEELENGSSTTTGG